MSEVLLRVCDVETTGIDPAVDRVVELAHLDVWLAPDGTVRRGNSWSTLVNPGIPIPATASAVHHLTDEHVKGAPRIEDVERQLILDGPAYLVSHNSRFDSKFVDSGLVPWLDTYRIARRLFPGAPSYSNQVLRYHLGLKIAGDAGPAHRALADCIVTGVLLRRCLAMAPLSDLHRWPTEPALLTSLSFGKHRGTPIADVPADYLRWLIEQSDKKTDEDIRFTVQTELRRRSDAWKATAAA